MSDKQPKPPAVFLVSIKITGQKAGDCRRFAKQIADAVEVAFEDPQGPVAYLTAFAQLEYELNLTRWEKL